MPTLNSHTHCQVAPADPQAKTWQRVWLYNCTTKPTDKQTDEKEHRSDNSTYPKVAVQWLYQALYYYQALCLVDRELLLNRHLRVAANRQTV